MFLHEREMWNDGVSFVAGVDEAGRGPLAGPVVAAAVVIPKYAEFPPVDDSKKLTDKQRRKLRAEIISVDKVLFSIAEVSADEIEKINILRATHSAMKWAVQKLKFVDFALIDGLPVPNFPVPSRAIVKGDSKSASIAAASILAKVHRDELMEKYAIKYPQYGFEKNKGYGTAAHLEALKKHGPCPIHRKTFAPVKKVLDNSTKIQQEFNLL